ncbi:MAG: hypothetical protein QOH96_2591 [Blastocatellia bacterium]|jgi:hypothetical protein|nr:hypothetical protein [Blastocatellia bacterium]
MNPNIPTPPASTMYLVNIVKRQKMDLSGYAPCLILRARENDQFGRVHLRQTHINMTR